MLSSPEQLCPYCTSPMPVGARFCGQCGGYLPATMNPAMVVLNGPSPERVSEKVSIDPGSAEMRRSTGNPITEGGSTSSSSNAFLETYPAFSDQDILLRSIQQKLNAGKRVLFAALVFLLLLGAGGAVESYIFTRLHPVVAVTGNFHVGSTPAGSSNFVDMNRFHISGQDFWPHSPITFLLDGIPLHGTPSAQSDSTGAFTADLIIASNWPLGLHHLTARDAKGYVAHTRGIDILATLYQANLTSDPGGWFCNSTCAFSTDGYHIQIPDNSVYPSYMTHQVFENGIMEVTGTIAKGDANNAEMDLIFRLQQNATLAGYLFRIFPDGTYGISRSAPDGVFTTLLGTTDTSSLKKGLNQPNTLKVEFSGSNFTLFINGQEVHVVSDTSYTTGYIGLGAGGTGTEAIFSNFLLSSV